MRKYIIAFIVLIGLVIFWMIRIRKSDVSASAELGIIARNFLARLKSEEVDAATAEGEVETNEGE